MHKNWFWVRQVSIWVFACNMITANHSLLLSSIYSTSLQRKCCFEVGLFQNFPSLLWAQHKSTVLCLLRWRNIHSSMICRNMSLIYSRSSVRSLHFIIHATMLTNTARFHWRCYKSQLDERSSTDVMMLEIEQINLAMFPHSLWFMYYVGERIKHDLKIFCIAANCVSHLISLHLKRHEIAVYILLYLLWNAFSKATWTALYQTMCSFTICVTF